MIRVVILIVGALFITFGFVGCGSKTEQPPAAKEEAKPTPIPRPAPEKGAPPPGIDSNQGFEEKPPRQIVH